MIKRIRLGGILGSLRWVFFIFLPLGFLKGAETPIPVQTVFIILMENHDWSTILGSPNCPYINNTLLPMASHCEQYYNPPGIHPSEPNYLWLVAGTNFGITNDKDPSINHQSSTNTLFLQLDRAGISWKTYQENISGLDCPDTNAYPYAVRHDPFVFFDAVRNDLSYCTNHVRPYTELQQDLQNNRVARYNFITPNVTNDMHDSLSGVSTRIQGDHWLSMEIPKLLASQAYSNNGAIFITFDEGSNSSSDGPIGMIVLSPKAKGEGYASGLHFTHSSTLRTMQNIFGVRPYLGDAANATDLSDLFGDAPPLLVSRGMLNGTFRLVVTNLVVGSTNYLQSSSNLVDWALVRSNVAIATSYAFSEPLATNNPRRFYRLKREP